jgi:hypothetical protein
MTAAIRAYQAAAKFYGETQAATAAASAKYHEAMETEQAGYRALHTAREQLLTAAEAVPLPDKVPLTRPVKDNPQA